MTIYKIRIRSVSSM